MAISRGLSLAVLAGCLAALASTSAKLAMSGSTALTVVCLAGYTYFSSPVNIADGPAFCENVILAIRGLFFGGIFVLNALMWTVFTKSLQHCSSSVEATVTNAASNFVFTALIGYLVFGESLSMKWWLGSMLIVLGLLLIHRGNSKVTIKKMMS